MSELPVRRDTERERERERDIYIYMYIWTCIYVYIFIHVLLLNNTPKPGIIELTGKDTLTILV